MSAKVMDGGVIGLRTCPYTANIFMLRLLYVHDGIICKYRKYFAETLLKILEI